MTRSNVEISLCILDTLSNGPTRITRLQSESNTSTKSLALQLSYLIEQGLIGRTTLGPPHKYLRRDGGLVYEYHITDKGKQVLVWGLQMYRALGYNLRKRVGGIRRKDV